jgi:hypothetical protein
VDKLVNQLVALKEDTHRFDRDFGGAAAHPARGGGAGAPNNNGANMSTADAIAVAQQLLAAQQWQQAGSPEGPPSPMPARAAPAPPTAASAQQQQQTSARSVLGSSSSSSRPAGNPATATPSVGGGTSARSVAGGSVAHSVRSVSPSRSVVYRSSIYRSASPSKAVGANGVVISSFSRASRFREDKADVPGPGKYAPHSTDFGPVTVPRATPSAALGSSASLSSSRSTAHAAAADPDAEGRLGHTWSAYYAKTGKKPTPQQQHEDAMAAATARFQPAGARAGAGGGGGGGGGGGPRSPGAASTVSFAQSLSLSPGGTVETSMTGFGAGGGGGGGSGATVEAHAQALLDGFHGDARLALEAAVKRERAMRKEVVAANKALNDFRQECANKQSLLTNALEAANARVAKKEAAVAKEQTRAKACRDALSRADESLYVLQQAIADAADAAANPRAGANIGPVLARAGAEVRSLAALLASAASFASPSSEDAGGGGGSRRSVAGSDVGGAGAGGGYIGYSSLTAALVAPEATHFGTLGPSERIVASINNKQSLLDASMPPPPPPKERPLTGAQARGIAPGVDNAHRTVNAGSIAAFARRAAAAADLTDGPTPPPSPPHQQQQQPQQPHPPPPQPQQQQHYMDRSPRGRSPSPARQPQQQQQQQQQQPSRGPPAAPPHVPGGPTLSVDRSRIAEPLDRLFVDYGGAGGALPSSEFVRMLTDAGALDGRTSRLVAEASFIRALRAGGATATNSTMTLALDQWIVALTDLACRKYGVGSPVPGASGVLVDTGAFRRLLDEHVLPLAARRNPQQRHQQQAGGEGGAGASSPAAARPGLPRQRDIGAALANFTDDFLKLNVLQVRDERRSI